MTGVSGSGKSSFVNEILYKKLAAELNGAKTRAGAHDEFIGIEKRGARFNRFGITFGIAMHF